jgi:hypothetical protein
VCGGSGERKRESGLSFARARSLSLTRTHAAHTHPRSLSLSLSLSLTPSLSLLFLPPSFPLFFSFLSLSPSPPPPFLLRRKECCREREREGGREGGSREFTEKDGSCQVQRILQALYQTRCRGSAAPDSRGSPASRAHRSGCRRRCCVYSAPAAASKGGWRCAPRWSSRSFRAAYHQPRM